jgi:nucleotide-binding universal stress UspA family protein
MSYGALNVLTDYTQIEIVKVLQSSYFESSDLIVLGAHSQSIKDIFIGSITKRLILEANRPLLIGI